MDDRLQATLNKIQKKSVRIQNATKNRYYDSPKVCDWSIVTVNDEGLFKLVGLYQGMRGFRYYFDHVDPAVTRKIIEEKKHDILKEFLSNLTEGANHED